MNTPFDLRFYGLPPELQIAPSEFEAWSQAQLLKEQDASMPNAPLYHYTGEEALKGILTHEKLWCFGHEYQTDREEFGYSMKIARQVIAEVGKSTDGPTKQFCDCLIDILDNNSFSSTFEFYLFSLSRHEDDPQQWRDFGQQGRGFALGLSPTLFTPNEMKLKEQANENLFVGRVIYGDAATEARHRLVIEKAASITSGVVWANRSLVTTIGPNTYLTYLKAMVDEVIASQLIWNCLTSKRDDYANEREVRFIVMNVVASFDRFRKVFNGKTYVEAPLPLKAKGSIKQILVGTDAPIDAENMVLDLLKINGYPNDIPVRRSSAIV